MGSSCGKYSAPAPVKDRYFGAFQAAMPSMAGLTVAITGTTSGTGFIAAQECAKKGATVLLLNRSSSRAAAALTALQESVPDGKFESFECDLQDLASVRAAAESIVGAHDSLDVLALNAGVMALANELTKDGFDVQMQTNMLSHFVLTRELLPLLEAGAAKNGEARVVAHTSISRLGGKLEAKYFDKGQEGKLGGNGSSMLLNGGRWERYHQTKLANATFTAALGDKLAAKGSKVITTMCHPGLAATNLQVTTASSGGMSKGWGTNVLMGYFSQSQADGALGLLTCISTPNVKNKSFYGPGSKVTSGTGQAKLLKTEKLYDNEAGKKLLWASCEKAVGEFVV